MQTYMLLEITACIVKGQNYSLHYGNPEDMWSTAFNTRLNNPEVSHCCNLAHPDYKISLGSISHFSANARPSFIIIP